MNVSTKIGTTMNVATEAKTDKVSIALLATAAIYGLSTIFIFYWNFLIFPPLLETTDDIKYAIGFFYIPLVSTVVALGALVLKFRAGSRKLARLCAQVGLLLSGSLIAWWLTFEAGFLPTILLPAFFLAVVINDWKENRQSSK